MTVGTLTIDWLPVGLLAGAAVGLVATFGMDLPMNRLPEGPTAPRVAAGTLSDATLESAPDGVATAAHYGAGIGTGVLFLAGVSAAQWLLDGTVLAVATAAVALGVLMNWFFSFVVVPTYGRVPDDRVGRVRRDWALSAAAYLLVASAVVAAALSVA
ncbi:hypothetical protein C475_21182 [Halosimplex carlsbadense 2-9-1]|uniref:Uncharacterized protein n=1 Tax=Halosimplex carlsbadense 2-9-1 TaxID=797114 RepID=M0CCF6_9EURY|nr:hypothetical protein [Halosimplex carlsbadense]ELZ20328.1 hypothetical protein C475_21182 [Halosimplex carlsbadense 2-9-1]